MTLPVSRAAHQARSWGDCLYCSRVRPFRASRRASGWMVCTGIGWPLLQEFGPDPKDQKKRQGYGEYDYARGEPHVQVAVRIVYGMVAAQVPCQKRKDGNAGGSKEDEERGGKGKQETGEEPEASEGKAEDFPALQLALCHMRQTPLLSSRIQFHGKQRADRTVACGEGRYPGRGGYRLQR